MIRRVLLACLGIGISVALAQPARAQDRENKEVGAGLGYTYDYHQDFLVITGLARIPVTPPNLLLKPVVLTPRFEAYPSANQWQVDLDGIWDVPVQPDVFLRPYLGIGVGVTHLPGTTAALFNLDAGVRYKKPSWDHEFAVETHYSAGLNYDNSMVVNFLVLFPVGKR